MRRFDRRSNAASSVFFNTSALFVIYLILGLIANPSFANNMRIVDFPPSNKCKDATFPERNPNVMNQYVLLLFFNKTAEKQVHEIFQTVPSEDNNHKGQHDGCWPNPTPDQEKLRVQGGCPTDCQTNHPKAPLNAVNRLNDKPNQQEFQPPSGDPLRDDPVPLLAKYDWGLFFADVDGSNFSENDYPTQFKVWQIFVADSLQAGLVLKSLYMDSRFQNLKTSGAYIGHIMIGYKPPPPPPKNAAKP
jgi:hypothetical protein